jgi:hypothetical protein
MNAEIYSESHLFSEWKNIQKAKTYSELASRDPPGGLRYPHTSDSPFMSNPCYQNERPGLATWKQILSGT